MMIGIFKFAAFSALILQSVRASSCDGSEADRLVEQVEVYNSRLETYASLLARGPTSSHFKLLDKRGVSTSEAHHAAAVTKVHVIEQQQHMTAAPKKVMSVNAAAKHFSTPSHVHTVVVTKQPQEQVHFSTYIPVEEQRHNALIRQGLDSLAQQQAVLDSMQNACIPASHKPKLINALTKTFTLYLVHHKNLAAVGNLAKRAHNPQVAGWLTMGNDVNSGYNGDEAELTSSSVSSSSTAPPWGYGYGYPAANYPPPQYSPQYITITVSPSTVNAPKATDTSDGGDSDGDDDGSDSDSSSPASTAPPVPAPAPVASPHHGIIYESTIGLVLGTFHFVEHLFGFGKSKQDLPGPSSALSELAEKVASVYKVKL